MKLTDLKINNLARINKINISDLELRLHLLELGLVKNTKIKIIDIINNELYIIKYRDVKITLTYSLAQNIEVI